MFPILKVKQLFTDDDGQATPEPVKQYIRTLEETIVQLLSNNDRLEKQIEALEYKSNKNSQNSSKPFSSDSPYKRPIRSFCNSVLNVSISAGAIQKVVDRASTALKPCYDAIGEKARENDINHVGETSGFQKGALHFYQRFIDLKFFLTDCFWL